MIEKEKQQVLSIFDEAIYKVSHKLLRIELRKMTDANGWKPDETKEYYRGVIHMHGYLNATLIYYFPEELYDYIVRTMNCGSLPSEDERQLYIGEFINITCGHKNSYEKNWFTKKQLHENNRVNIGIVNWNSSSLRLLRQQGY